MKDWERYERTAQFLLNEFATHFGLDSVEGKQDIPGASGTSWEIDAKGVKIDGEGFLIVECRRRKSRQSQEHISALAYKINDTGAQGGILITAVELQRGARKIAEHEGIHHVILDRESTTEAYVIEFLGKVIMGLAENLAISDSYYIGPAL